LNGPNRLAKILDLLDTEVKKGAVICLQEVGTVWASELHSFFAKRGYYFVVRHYGSDFNDYMGVGIAVPMEHYEVEALNSKRVADTIWLPRKDKPGIFARFWAWLVSMFVAIAVFVKLYQVPFNTWWEIKKRWNVLICAELTFKKTGARFIISTYHMPCAFNHQDVMVVHGALALQKVQEAAAKAGDIPYLLLGDFNWKPHDPMYQLYEEGDIDAHCPARPPAVEGLKWTPAVKPVRSVYKVANGAEPEYTNNAHVRQQEPFKECLDYIFMSPEWAVHSVLPVNPESKADLMGPFPDETQPSDHIMLGAWVTLN